MREVRAALATAIIVLASAAQAGTFWGHSDTRRRDGLVAVGDRHLRDAKQTEAAVRGSPAPTSDLVRDYLAETARAALGAYEKALEIGPETVELHYRAYLAAVLLIESHEGILAGYKEAYLAVVRHIEDVRRLSPLDNREDEFSYEAGIAYSKLGALGGPEADGHFEHGIREYERFRSVDGNQLTSDLLAPTYSNEAELLMAVGRLDEAIANYRISIELNPMEPLNYFGLAVALDRNGEWSKAVEAMTLASEHGHGVERLKDATVFFVPSGDIHYYYALFHQVRGDAGLAAMEYRRFLERCHDSKYAARAKAHLGELGQGTGDAPPPMAR
jgi:tetratricopeptide (TPR) repeat protein